MQSDANPAETGISTQSQDAFGAPKIIYILYLVGLVLPIVALGGLVYAYLSRGKDADADTHLTFQIRMFWWGLLIAIVGTALSVVLIGWAVLLAWIVWVLTRCITGLKLASASQPITEVGPLGFTAR